MKKTFILLATVMINYTLLFPSVLAQAQAGALDLSFGTNGQVTIPSGEIDNNARSVAVQADGKIVVAGAVTSGNRRDLAAVRYNIDGTLDTDFDNDGIATWISEYPEEDHAYAFSVAIQPDGKILVSGRTEYRGVIVRFNANGSLDQTFGTLGLTGTTEFIEADAITLQNGKIVVAGNIENGVSGIVRYNSDGSLDAGFGNNGIVTVPFRTYSYTGVLATQGDKIVAVGYADNKFAVARFNGDGSLDASFDNDGQVTTDFGAPALATCVAIQPDGKIVVAGNVAGRFGLARYNNNGSLDTDFDADGTVTTTAFVGIGNNDFANSLLIQPDGKIVVVGEQSNNSRFIAARYNTNGNLDTDFDLDGKVSTYFDGNGTAGALSAAMQSDKIVLAGYYLDDNSNEHFALTRYYSTSASSECLVDFPDATFKAALVGNTDINTDHDGEISCAEASAYTGLMNVSGLQITDLTGIEKFTALTQLYCGQNKLTSLNLSANTALTALDCGFNRLTSLNITQNTSLTSLTCNSNQLSQLDLSHNVSLTSLNCNVNSLTSLDVSGLPLLNYLACFSNRLTSLDVSANTHLTALFISENYLTSLNISQNHSLGVLNCPYNQLSSLDFSGVTTLTSLTCNNNRLTSLDVSTLSSLREFKCSDNLLTELNLKNGNNTNLLLNASYFGFKGNAQLTCIQVDDQGYADLRWSDYKDPGARFSTNCSLPPCTVPPSASVSGNASICARTSSTLTADGGDHYAWSDGGDNSTLNVTTGTSVTVSPRQTTTYTVTVSNSCGSMVAQQEVRVNSLPTPVITGSNTICNGATNILTASGATSYVWSGGTANGSQTSITTPGPYTVTATDNNGCVATASKTVTLSPSSLPNVSITPSGPTTFCKGNYISLRASGGTSTYLWSNGITTNSIQVTTSGTYSVTVSNSCGAVTASQDVTVNPIPVAGITADNTQVCPGAQVTLTGSGGTAYSWSGGTPSGLNTVINAVGTYTVTATDANGCTAKATKTIAAGSLPVAAITANGPTTFCRGGSVALRASSGTSYLWSNGSGASFITTSTSNNYTVTITNACGTTVVSQNVTVNNPPVISITASTAQVCPGAEVTLTATGANTYVWSGGAATGNQTVINTGGSYSVTATDGNGCKAIMTKAIPAGNLPVATITPSGSTTFCRGSYISLKAAGGTSYAWSGSSITSSSIQVTTGGVYVVTVTNSCGNNTASQNITVNAVPVAGITASNTVVCPGAEVTLTGSGGTTYAWSGGNASGNQTVVNTGGTYTVTATDANGCSAKVSKTLTSGSASIIPSSTATFCTGGSVTLRGTGGAAYKWSFNGSTSSSITVSNSGTYIVTVTNACGKTTVSQDVTVNTPPNVSIQADGPTTFNAGSSVNLMTWVTGNGGYSFDWTPSDPSNHSPFLNVTATGTYTVSVKDKNGCTGQASQAVMVNGSPRKMIDGNKTAEEAVAFSAYPNPFSSELSLQYGLHKDQKITIELMDLNGKVLSVPVKGQMMAAGNHEYRLNANEEHLSAGLYLLRFTSEEKSEMIKISYIK